MKLLAVKSLLLMLWGTQVIAESEHDMNEGKLRKTQEMDVNLEEYLVQGSRSGYGKGKGGKGKGKSNGYKKREHYVLKYECDTFHLTWLVQEVWQNGNLFNPPPAPDFMQGDSLLISAKLCEGTCGEVIYPPYGTGDPLPMPPLNVDPKLVGSVSLKEGLSGDNRVPDGGYILPGGSITFQGAVTEIDHEDLPGDELPGFHLAITGGTGIYAGATGTIFVDRQRAILTSTPPATPARTTTLHICVPKLPFYDW